MKDNLGNLNLPSAGAFSRRFQRLRLMILGLGEKQSSFQRSYFHSLRPLSLSIRRALPLPVTGTSILTRGDGGVRKPGVFPMVSRKKPHGPARVSWRAARRAPSRGLAGCPSTFQVSTFNIIDFKLGPYSVLWPAALAIQPTAPSDPSHRRVMIPPPGISHHGLLQGLRVFVMYDFTFFYPQPTGFHPATRFETLRMMLMSAHDLNEAVRVSYITFSRSDARCNSAPTVNLKPSIFTRGTLLYVTAMSRMSSSDHQLKVLHTLVTIYHIVKD